MKPEPKSNDKNKARYEITEIVQKFAEFWFQVFRARDLAVTTIKDAVGLEDGRADHDAAVITAQ